MKTKFFQKNQNKYFIQYFVKKIISGGQTGVDRAALDTAIKFNIPHSGRCPAGRLAEDGIISKKYKLKEAPTPTAEQLDDPNAIYNIRTELNVKNADGTLIILKEEPIGGTLFTIDMAKKHQKPYLILNVTNDNNIENIANWITKNNIFILNVAGPRASQAEGIYNITCNVLTNLLNYQLTNKVEPASIQKNPQ